MDSSEQLIAEADLLLELSSQRLKQARTRSEVPLSGKDSLLIKCKDAIEQLNLEIQEEKRIRSELETTVRELEDKLESAQKVIQDLRTDKEKRDDEAKGLKGGLDEAVRKAAKKKEEEIRDLCAKKEAKMKLELKGIIEQLEEELEASTLEHQATKDANIRLNSELSSLRAALNTQMESLIGENKHLKHQLLDLSSQTMDYQSVSQLTDKLNSEMQKRLKDKAEFKSMLQRDKSALKAKVEEKDRIIKALREELMHGADAESAVASSQQIVLLTSQVKEERLKRLHAERELLTLKRELFEQHRTA